MKKIDIRKYSYTLEELYEYMKSLGLKDRLDIFASLSTFEKMMILEAYKDDGKNLY